MRCLFFRFFSQQCQRNTSIIILTLPFVIGIIILFIELDTTIPEQQRPSVFAGAHLGQVVAYVTMMSTKGENRLWGW